MQLDTTNLVSRLGFFILFKHTPCFAIPIQIKLLFIEYKHGKVDRKVAPLC
jgi:hypothetical protein